MNLIQDARALAIAEIEQYGLPSKVLFEVSEKKAVELAQKMHADEMIVRIGVVLMDLKLGQAVKNGHPFAHVAIGAQAAREFLEKYDLEEDVIKKIINCIEAHHKDVPFKCVEAEICANAACYRYIHPKGFFEYLHILSKTSSDVSECLTLAEKKLDEKIKMLTIMSCREELDHYYMTIKNFIVEARKY